MHERQLRQREVGETKASKHGLPVTAESLEREIEIRKERIISSWVALASRSRSELYF